MSQTRDQQRFTISEVAADWHEPSKEGNRKKFKYVYSTMKTKDSEAFGSQRAEPSKINAQSS